MANRNFNRVQCLDKEIKIIHGQISIGASGAATLSASKSVGVKSVDGGSGSTLGAGIYKVTLGTPGGDTDTYNHFFGSYFDIQKDTHLGGTTGGMAFQLKGAPTVSTDGVIDFYTLDKDGSAADPGSGETIHFVFFLKNSAQPGVGV
tara:strand:- start:106 stop:546 length:441 start_codon:yes stop_codon:yes gene_type:complete